MTGYRPYNLDDLELLNIGKMVGRSMTHLELIANSNLSAEQRRAFWQFLEKKVSEQAGLYEAGAVVTARAGFSES